MSADYKLKYRVSEKHNQHLHDKWQAAQARIAELEKALDRIQQRASGAANYGEDTKSMLWIAKESYKALSAKEKK